jgi:hypothetical protein
LIRLAIVPAPNPLSMLTTTTPSAQVFIIVRRGAIPLKLAPYPTLVGTAITGFEANPPTILGRAPADNSVPSCLRGRELHHTKEIARHQLQVGLYDAEAACASTKDSQIVTTSSSATRDGKGRFFGSIFPPRK